MKHLMLFGLSLLAAQTSAQATSTAPLTLTQQARKAQLIVRATVGAATNAKEGEVSYLAYPLNISETVVGDPANLPQVGGKPALFFLQGAQDLPQISVGTEAFFLLYNGKMDSPVVGFNQGFYPVQNGKVVPAPTSLTAPAGAATTTAAAGAVSTVPTDPVQLRNAIRAALGDK